MNAPDRSLVSRVTGRGAAANPGNRFERIQLHVDESQLEGGEGVGGKVATEFYEDDSRTIIRENFSPDVPFRFSINPYRGCEHGCAYCYARPGHETLGLGAGIDFETKILVKRRACQLLRDELNSPRWQGEPVTLSGVTDCYQPAERYFKLTRSLIEVLVEAQQAFSIVTKNALVKRDLDLLTAAARCRLVHVYLSVTTLDSGLARVLEPRTSAPAARLEAIRVLHAAGVPVGAMVAPVIPGLNDHEIPVILRAVREAGAQAASMVLLRLPQAVAPIFTAWLRTAVPERSERVLGRIRACRGGRLSDPRFGSRMRGEGAYADHLRQTFDTFVRRHGLACPLPALDTSRFRPPRSAEGQQSLF
jgi:DNA repair photolyase